MPRASSSDGPSGSARNSKRRQGWTSAADAPAGVGMEGFLGQQVVFDTEGPIMFLGTLREVLPEGYWLENADIRDRNEGHVSKERYACEAKVSGIRANRRRIFVMAKVVISASALDDVIVDFPEE